VIDAGELTREFFEGRIGEVFTLVTQPVVELKLAEVVAWGPQLGDGGRDPFRLDFSGPAGLRMPQRIYRMSLASGEVMELFLVQNADAPDGSSRAEAIFS
jgi:hypothetical protein